MQPIAEDTRTPRAPLSPLSFWLLSVVVGIVAGLAAVVFRGMIALLHNLLFLRTLSAAYDANLHTPASPWGALVVLVPVAGALGVAFLVKNFAPEAKGHGVPEVIDAIYFSKGLIRPVVALVKAAASALSIGSGGSVGREGPIIQIGSSFGSTIGQLLRLPVWQTIALIACGAGGGIAATFNTPVGGVLFALEIMMQEVSVRTLVPVAISTATATYVGRLFFGPHPSFVIPAFETSYFHLTKPTILIAYAALGLLCGVASTILIKAIYGTEDLFDKKVPGNYYTKHAIGMFLVGLMMYLLFFKTGHYYIEGVGYSAVQDMLSGTRFSLSFLMVLLAFKLFATCLTLGSGASGGIFSPSIYIGAMLGGAYGILLLRLFPGLAVDPSAFAVAGMAGVVGGGTGAAVAAIVMIFEMTLDYNVIVPMTIVVAISYGVRRLLSEESIYTLKLARRGHYVPASLQANPSLVLHAKDLMDVAFAVVPSHTTIVEFAKIVSEGEDVTNYLVAEGGTVVGLISKEAALGALEEKGQAVELGAVASKDYVVAAENTTLFEVAARMRASGAVAALVVRQRGQTDRRLIRSLRVRVRSVRESLGMHGGRPVPTRIALGLITPREVADALLTGIEAFSD